MAIHPKRRNIHTNSNGCHGFLSIQKSDLRRRNRWCWPETSTLFQRPGTSKIRPRGSTMLCSGPPPAKAFKRCSASGSPTRCAPSPTRPASTRSGIIRPAPGRKTTACASITCCYRRRPATGSSTPESTVTCGPGKNRRTTCRSGSISICTRRKTAIGDRISGLPAPKSVLAALHPVLEHLQRHRAVILGCLADRLVVTVLDPGFVGGGAIPRQCQPHQPASRLTRQLVAVEQHLAEQRLRLMLTLLSGQAGTE